MGSSGSKETVQCFHCEATTRLDNLERHSEVQHPGKPVRHKFIVTSNQRTLLQILTKKVDYDKASDSQEEKEEKSGEPDEITETEEHESGTTDKPEDGTEVLVSMKRSRDSNSGSCSGPPKKILKTRWVFPRLLNWSRKEMTQ